ncbi:hypothetical protein [Devosia sp.]|uniref:hypothetical protein n=1 Tax=Devosia sp. TaxID=1871048 RepID=UPI002EE0A526
MRNFSPSSFNNHHEDMVARARAAVAGDPQALFTDFQWFLFTGRDTIFFTAFSAHRFDKAQLKGFVAQMVELAPQLTLGFAGARPGEALTDAQIEAVTSAEDVDSLEGYPERWLSESADIFAHPDLPLFRVMVANRSAGPDAGGRASVVQVRAAHALLEGSDSALMMRSQLAAHGIMSDKSRKVALGKRARGAWGGLLIAIPHLLFAHLLSPPARQTHFRTLALPRARLRRLATKFGVGQRAMYFALVTFALFREAGRRRNKDAVAVYYTVLDTERHAADDDFFRVRTLNARFPVHDDFAAYVRGVDEAMREVEKRDTHRVQMAVNAMFSTHRALHRLFPWLYGPRFWRFQGRSDIVLTMVPPHYAMGPLTEWTMEPVYVGAFHPSSNICTFCPGREFMTISFALGKAGTDKIDEIVQLIADAEATDVAPLPAGMAAAGEE